MPDRSRISKLNTAGDTSQADWLLMQAVAAGEEEAVADLYDRFGPLVYKVSRQILPSRSEAEDAVQEVFVRLWQSADRFDPRRAKLVTWVMLIARRHLIDRLRRRATRPTSTDQPSWREQDTEPTPAQRMMDQDRNAELHRRIAELPDLQREVIERAYLQGFTLREVSEQMDTPLGTVKSALSRGLARLREKSPTDQAM